MGRTSITGQRREKLRMSCRTGRKRWKGKGAMGLAEVREKRDRWAAGLLLFFSSFHLFFFLQNYFRKKKTMRRLEKICN
jgi:hypothetical protein